VSMGSLPAFLQPQVLSVVPNTTHRGLMASYTRDYTVPIHGYYTNMVEFHGRELCAVQPKPRVMAIAACNTTSLREGMASLQPPHFPHLLGTTRPPP
jgi:hypothetical protein